MVDVNFSKYVTVLFETYLDHRIVYRAEMSLQWLMPIFRCTLLYYSRYILTMGSYIYRAELSVQWLRCYFFLKDGCWASEVQSKAPQSSIITSEKTKMLPLPTPTA